MALKFYTKDQNGENIETLSPSDACGWEFTLNDNLHRVIFEKVEITPFVKSAHAIFSTEMKDGNTWKPKAVVGRDFTFKAIASANTYRSINTGDVELDPYIIEDDETKPIMGEPVFEGLNELNESVYSTPIVGYEKKMTLKNGLISEWDMFVMLFMQPSAQCIGMQEYLRQGASIKIGLNLTN